MAEGEGWLTVDAAGGELRIAAGGPWTVAGAGTLDRIVREVHADGAGAARLDLSQLSELDTAGAWLLYRLQRDLTAAGVQARASGLSARHQPLFALVEAAERAHAEVEGVRVGPFVAMVNRVGRAVFAAADEGKQLVNFFGLVILRLFACLLRPRHLRVTALVNQMEQTGINAMPVVGVLQFLLGIVIAYLFVDQLSRFGAETFAVNGLAYGMSREISVLITAILIAGRSGSAFTAQIGTMKVREEVDALHTVGLDPIEVLVLPRVLALVIMLPLLTFFANVMGFLGGGVMFVLTLDLSPEQVLQLLRDKLQLTDVLVGLVKAPVFAFIVALVGCYEGLRVGGSAESVGLMTTKSVVEAIFLVILADAIFAIIFITLGI